MKAFFAILFTVGIFAQKTTERNCMCEQGARLVSNSTGLMLNLRDEFEIENESSCNIIAYDNVQLDWLSSQISVQFWVQNNQFFVKSEYEERKKAMDEFKAIQDKRCLASKAEAASTRDAWLASRNKEVEEIEVDATANKIIDETKDEESAEEGEFAPESTEEAKQEGEDELVSDIEESDVEADEEEATEEEEESVGEAWGQWMRKGLLLKQGSTPETEEEAAICDAQCEIDKLKAQIDKIKSSEKEEGGKLCLDMDVMPKQYKKGTLLVTAAGICGFRLQVTNKSKFAFNFIVHRDGAANLAVGSAALMSLYMLF